MLRIHLSDDPEKKQVGESFSIALKSSVKDRMDQSFEPNGLQGRLKPSSNPYTKRKEIKRLLFPSK
jgi:hypothetical protein